MRSALSMLAFAIVAASATLGGCERDSRQYGDAPPPPVRASTPPKQRTIASQVVGAWTSETIQIRMKSDKSNEARLGELVGNAIIQAGEGKVSLTLSSDGTYSWSSTLEAIGARGDRWGKWAADSESVTTVQDGTNTRMVWKLRGGKLIGETDDGTYFVLKHN